MDVTIINISKDQSSYCTENSTGCTYNTKSEMLIALICDEDITTDEEFNAVVDELVKRQQIVNRCIKKSRFIENS